MQKISELIERFRNFQNKDQKTKDVLSSVIEKVTGIKIEVKNIKINGVVARIQTNQSTKIKILIKKEEILNETRLLVSNKTPRDII